MFQSTGTAGGPAPDTDCESTKATDFAALRAQVESLELIGMENNAARTKEAKAVLVKLDEAKAVLVKLDEASTKSALKALTRARRTISQSLAPPSRRLPQEQGQGDVG